MKIELLLEDRLIYGAHLGGQSAHSSSNVAEFLLCAEAAWDLIREMGGSDDTTITADELLEISDTVLLIRSGLRGVSSGMRIDAVVDRSVSDSTDWVVITDPMIQIGSQAHWRIVGLFGVASFEREESGGGKFSLDVQEVRILAQGSVPADQMSSFDIKEKVLSVERSLHGEGHENTIPMNWTQLQGRTGGPQSR